MTELYAGPLRSSRMSEADDGAETDGDRANDDPADGEDARDDSVTAGTAFVVFLFGELGALVFYLVVSRSMWFFLDEWDFLAHRTAFNVHDLFEPHNEHWVTLPVLLY